MIYQDIWKAGDQMGLTAKLDTAGKTPWQSLGARLYVEVRDNEHSKFVKVGSRPTRFFLRERASILPLDAAEIIEKAETKQPQAKFGYMNVLSTLYLRITRTPIPPSIVDVQFTQRR
jgi:hypothetical protein